MVDLNSTLFFKGKFQIHAKNQDTDLLWQLVLTVRSWMCNKWKRKNEDIPWDTALWSRWKQGCNFSSNNEIVHFKSVLHRRQDSMALWACKIIESGPPKLGHAPRQWVTEIGFEQDTDSCATLSIVIYYSDRPGFIGPCETAPSASLPKLIQLFINNSNVYCTAEGYPLKLKATHLSVGDFPDFWKVVCDENRAIPVIYISPRRVSPSQDTASTLLDPDTLAGILGPNALVYYADDINFSREMTELCTPLSYGCYSGNIRIYAAFPNPTVAEDGYRHRRISFLEIQENPQAVYEMLRRAFAQDVHFYDKMFRMEDCRQLNDFASAEQRRLESKQALEDALLSDIVCQEAKLKEELNRIEDERFEWELERYKLQDQIKELKADLHLSKTREEGLRYAADVSASRKSSLDSVRSIKKYPETPFEIAHYFETHFGDRLVFTERGHASLAECKTSPSILWDALYQMATILYDLYENDDVSLVGQEFERRTTLSFARNAGMMTRKDAGLMRQYVDTYKGKEINIEPHIKTNETKETSPKFLRIYFCYDNETRKILIGSCGPHLRNYTTSKIT